MNVSERPISVTNRALAVKDAATSLSDLPIHFTDETIRLTLRTIPVTYWEIPLTHAALRFKELTVFTYGRGTLRRRCNMRLRGRLIPLGRNSNTTTCQPLSRRSQRCIARAITVRCTAFPSICLLEQIVPSLQSSVSWAMIPGPGQQPSANTWPISVELAASPNGASPSSFRWTL
jgi:hypothetical protein